MAVRHQFLSLCTEQLGVFIIIGYVISGSHGPQILVPSSGAASQPPVPSHPCALGALPPASPVDSHLALSSQRSLIDNA
ncbi:hypothetical protein K504DRAFT_506156 [Pleomassaria siparia CBS 279.74]|uniref:Uncharacterized protein n=1 Tax=Pleomassaria siparia CBS 279.74 TaxID=1314801 RepID=A0A6G1JX73_9PLEO|nr:hypothetical protein K504DRAFT_506156 [Pleomassaria siparia CBS 279.74]